MDDKMSSVPAAVANGSSNSIRWGRRTRARPRWSRIGTTACWRRTEYSDDDEREEEPELSSGEVGRFVPAAVSRHPEVKLGILFDGVAELGLRGHGNAHYGMTSSVLGNLRRTSAIPGKTSSAKTQAKPRKRGSADPPAARVCPQQHLENGDQVCFKFWLIVIISRCRYIFFQTLAAISHNFFFLLNRAFP